MKIPDEFKLRKDWIYEVIVTSGENAAPMGIKTSDFERVEMEVYKDSETYRNVSNAGRFKINFVNDVGVFYDSVFDKGGIEFENGHLKDADAFIEMEVHEKEDMGDRVRIISFPVGFEVIREPKLFNRAESLFMESLIAKTKIPHVSGKEKGFLEMKIEDNLRVVRKVAPGSGFERILEGF